MNKKYVYIIVAVVFVFIIIVGSSNNDSSNDLSSVVNDNSSDFSSVNDNNSNSISLKNNDNSSSEDELSIGQKNALKTAYLNYSGFSKVGLKNQLEFEGYTTSEAEYGVKSVGY